VHLAHPLGVKMFSYRRVKNDERDAGDLADLLRMSRLPEAWIAPLATRELRGWVRHRAKLVGLRSSLKCQIRVVLAGALRHGTAGRAGGLDDRSKSGRSPTRTRSGRIGHPQAAPEAARGDHWPLRLLPRELGVSTGRVAKVWKDRCLQPGGGDIQVLHPPKAGGQDPCTGCRSSTPVASAEQRGGLLYRCRSRQ